MDKLQEFGKAHASGTMLLLIGRSGPEAFGQRQPQLVASRFLGKDDKASQDPVRCQDLVVLGILLPIRLDHPAILGSHH